MVSFLCSILEVALLCFTPSFIESLREEKPSLSELLSNLKGNVDMPLAAILSLNTAHPGFAQMVFLLSKKPPTGYLPVSLPGSYAVS